MKCLIIATEQGEPETPGLLTPLLGVPVIERVVRSAVTAGLDDLYLITCPGDGLARQLLDKLALTLAVSLTHITDAEEEKSSVRSTLKAREHIREDFILLTTDSLTEPSLIAELAARKLSETALILVTAKGKPYPSGPLLCSSAIFAALNRSLEDSGERTLAGSIRLLFESGKIGAHKTGNNRLLSLTGRNGMKRAENMILTALSEKNCDGPVSRHLNRPFSKVISRYLVRTAFTPNQISFFSFLLSVIASLLFIFPYYVSLMAGGIIAQIASIVDGCDGEVARLKYLESRYGGWFDAVLDRYADAFLLAGLTFHAYASHNSVVVLFTGFMAVTGSFMISYTADKYDSLMAGHFRQGAWFRIGRDLRVLVIATGAVLNQPFITLLIIAFLMNFETVRRVRVCRE